MSQLGRAMKAYATAAAARDPRAQEAEVFRYTNAILQRAMDGDDRMRARALADNNRLWNAVIHLLHDPDNALPEPLRAAIVSVGLAVQREMRNPYPDFAFLIAVNENMAIGLSKAG